MPCNLPVALVLLTIRSELSSMDVPTRTAYVMVVVVPPECAGGATFAAVPLNLATAISLTISGALLAAGWISLSLIACGLRKITCDLTLRRAMRQDRLDGGNCTKRSWFGVTRQAKNTCMRVPFALDSKRSQ